MRTVCAVVILSCFLGNSLASAQIQPKVIWEQNLPFEPLFLGTGPDTNSFCYAASKKEIMGRGLRNSDTIWRFKLPEQEGRLMEIEAIIPNWELGQLLLLVRLYGKRQSICMQASTGETLWKKQNIPDLHEGDISYLAISKTYLTSSPAGLALWDAKKGDLIWTNNEIKAPIGLLKEVGDGHLLLLTCTPKAGQYGWKNSSQQVYKLNLHTGEAVWSQAYAGYLERKIVSNEPTCRMEITGNKIEVYTSGYQEFDYLTGEKRADIEAYSLSKGKPSFTKETGTVVARRYYLEQASLLKKGDTCYFPALEDDATIIKKVSLHPFSQIWSSSPVNLICFVDSKYEGNVNEMLLKKNVLVGEYGGKGELQLIIRRHNADGTHTDTKKINPYRFSLGLHAWDITTGKGLWGERNLQLVEGANSNSSDTLYAYIDGLIRALNLETGKSIYTTSYKIPYSSDLLGIKIISKKWVVINTKHVLLFKQGDGSEIAKKHFKISRSFSLKAIHNPANQILLQGRRGSFLYIDLLAGTLASFRYGKGSQAFMLADKSILVFRPRSLFHEAKWQRVRVDEPNTLPSQ